MTEKKESEKNNGSTEKHRALENALRQIEKDYGAGSIMRLGDLGSKANMEVISTGSLALDIAVGIGGYPGEGSLKSMDRSHRARQLWRCMPLRKRRKSEEWRLLLMRSMPWIPFMHVISV